MLYAKVNHYYDFICANISTGHQDEFYNEGMSSCIQRTATANGYIYSIIAGQEDALIPLNGDNAKRFCNWDDPNNHPGTHTGGGYGESGHEGDGSGGGGGGE